MSDPMNNFLPELIDQQVEQPDASLPRAEAELVHDLQAMYKRERGEAIDRVWERMAHSSSFAHSEAGEFSPQERVRNLPARREERPVRPARRFTRALGLIAAALVCVVLVGSLALVLAAQRNVGLLGGSQHPTPTTPKGTPTPAIPAQCLDSTFNADQTLCATGQETILNITKDFGSHKITFVRAYADSTRMMLVYNITDDPSSDAISFTSITIQQGIVIGDHPGESGAGGCFSNPTGSYCLEEFSMQRVPAGSTEIRVQAIVDGLSNVTTPLHFTVPLHTGHKTVNVNQTVTSDGVSLTLERLEFTESTLTVVFSPQSPPYAAFRPLVTSIIINGVKILHNSGSAASDGEEFDLALMGSAGAWEIQLQTMVRKPPTSKSLKSISWAFHFSVSR